MNKCLIISFILLCLNSFAQHSAGFDAKEARDLIQICNSFTYLDLEGSDEKIIPGEYTRIYTSPAYGMDNMFQVYVNQSKTRAVLNFRGSTDKKSSWLENMYSSLVPAKDSIIKGENVFAYKCAEDQNAAIHAGYILG